MHTMKKTELLVSIIGAFVATLIASYSSYLILQVETAPIILASTGASALLIFGAPHSAASQPWNIVGGQVISGLVGVACYQFVPNELIASSLTIPFSMLFMHFFRCMHPPGGATAVTAVIGGDAVHNLGYVFVVVPVLLNAIILLSFAMAAGTLREKNPYDVESS